MADDDVLLPAYVPSPLRTPPPASPQRKRVAVAQPERLYRTAHDLHFKAHDPGKALAAWDAYLAAEPNGRFAVEARYNRALALVRLGRYADAREALAPFAAGTLGYRVDEAKQLVERLARISK